MAEAEPSVSAPASRRGRYTCALTSSHGPRAPALSSSAPGKGSRLRPEGAKGSASWSRSHVKSMKPRKKHKADKLGLALASRSGERDTSDGSDSWRGTSIDMGERSEQR